MGERILLTIILGIFFGWIFYELRSDPVLRTFPKKTKTAVYALVGTVATGAIYLTWFIY